MGPWDIIGWTVIILIVLLILMAVGGFAAGFAVRRMLHLQDRDKPPEVGQRWLTANRSWPQPYEVTRVTEAGDVHYRRGTKTTPYYGQWTATGFRDVVYNTKAWLER